MSLRASWNWFRLSLFEQYRNDYVGSGSIRVITPSSFHPLKRDFSYAHCHRFRTICSVSSDSNANGFVNRPDHGADHEGLAERGGTPQQGSFTTDEMLKQLRRYGVAGVLSYGLLNTVYYLTTFLLVWFYFAPAPGKMGYFAAVKRFLKVMAMVWAGSQVTKLIRAGGALALAPFVDKGLSWFTEKFNFTSRGKAFFTIVGFCFGLAVVLFLVVTAFGLKPSGMHLSSG